MDQIITSFAQSGALYHAYFLVGESEAIRSSLFSFLEGDVGVAISANPDFWHGTFRSFSIDHARALTERGQSREFGGGRKIFIIETEIMTEEAQNALLKVFEEPTEGTHFFIISPQDILLPTLRSRMQVVVFGSHEDAGGEKKQTILNMNFAERLALVKEITEGIADEDKTKQDAITLLNAIERELYTTGVLAAADALRTTQSARASLYDRGAPVKMILEQVMLVV